MHKKKICYTNSNYKKTGMALLSSEKMFFKTNSFATDKEYFIMIKESIHQEHIKILNFLCLCICVPKCVCS